MGLATPFPVIVHPFESKTPDSCAYEYGNASSRNAFVFIGGLGDGPHTVVYARQVAKALMDAKDLDYSMFEFRMRSSYIGFGSSSLANDVADISAFVKYLRSLGKEKIVLAGHSTGCQDCMEYTNYAKHNNEPVDGFILQAPVSDRDVLHLIMPNPQPSIELATKMIAEGRAQDCMPQDMVSKVIPAPMTAYRFLSLAAKGGDDDYFSADIKDAEVKKYWGRFQKPVLVLHSSEDEFVPEEIDQAAQNQKFREANSLVSPLSGLIPGANHSIQQPEAREWTAERMVEFLKTL